MHEPKKKNKEGSGGTTSTHTLGVVKRASRQAQQEQAQERRGHRRQPTLTAELKQKAVAKERNRRRRATRLKNNKAYQVKHGVG